ncbi:MAG TPA: plastocyanin/azurin family copper-binding protein [Gemmatimonadaceae bacterium]|nr:plastocyanin/azurin family copper-binding protein [Gemmatimonadaceae bacterium]
MNRKFSALGSRLSALVIAAGIIAACSGDSGGSAGSTSGAAPAADAAPSVTPTGKVIIVEMYTDGTGNYFKPKDIEAHRGDIVRFVLKSGVHNVNFLPDSNPGKTGLPKASDFLQLPDQEFDVLVSMAPGHYYFQCDPHALLGMVGKLEVEDEN